MREARRSFCLELLLVDEETNAFECCKNAKYA
jgi:hypothetical protein